MVIIPIRSDIDVFKARRIGRELARAQSFSTRDYSIIEIVISELATNIIKYGIDGTIRIETLDDGLEITCEDRGPGLTDINCLEQNQQKKGATGLGIGLTGVRRLMDHFELTSEPGKGTRIVVKKWKNPLPHLPKPRQEYQVPEDGRLEYGVISTPFYGAAFNGDAFVIREFDDQVLLAVIDGLGHGKDACQASQVAAEYVQTHFRQNPAEIIAGCHRALHHSRGVVMGVVEIELGKAILRYAGVGNIGVKIVGPQPLKLISSVGIVGHSTRNQIREDTFPYDRGNTIVIYSDGIAESFDPDQVLVRERNVQEIAEHIARQFGKDQDDATIIIARERT